MSFAVDDVRRCRPEDLRAVARLLGRERALLDDLAAHLAGSLVPGWAGEAALAAAAEHEALLRDVQLVSRGVALTQAALLAASEGFDGALWALHRADRLAGAAGGWIDADGRLRLPARATSLEDPGVALLLAREEARVRWEAEAAARRGCDLADATDRELAWRLSEAAAQDVCFVRAGGAARPWPLARFGASEAHPYASSAWWQTLSEEERRWAIREHPEWIGPRDGIPAAMRHEANLLLLARAERDAVRALADVRRRAPGDPLLGVGLQGVAVGHLERRRVEALAAIREVVERGDGVPHQLLLLDASGPLVMAAVAVGDVDRAEHVATFVGGLTTNVRSDLRRYDQTFTRMRTRGRALAGGADLAIVTWMGYPAPQATEVLSPGGRSVLGDRLARESADALAAFANGIDASRERPVHQTLWAHSYGSVVGGYALRRVTEFDDAVLFGSPGVAFTSLSEAGLKPGALNVLRADGDLVARSGWHLKDPAHITGANILSTAWTKPTGLNEGLRAVGHSEYLKAGSTSEHNLLAVAVGRPDLRLVEAIVP